MVTSLSDVCLINYRRQLIHLIFACTWQLTVVFLRRPRSYNMDSCVWVCVVLFPQGREAAAAAARVCWVCEVRGDHAGARVSGLGTLPGDAGHHPAGLQGPPSQTTPDQGAFVYNLCVFKGDSFFPFYLLSPYFPFSWTLSMFRLRSGLDVDFSPWLEP